MKIGGVEVKGPSEEFLVLPRPSGEDIVFRARAVDDMERFEELCPPPKAPTVIKKGGVVSDTNSQDYKNRLEKHSELRMDYIIINSLIPSEIEWAKVNLNQPGTWALWRDELREAGISPIEINRIVVCVLRANALDEAKLEEARSDFLHRMAQAAQEESTGPDTEQPSS